MITQSTLVRDMAHRVLARYIEARAGSMPMPDDAGPAVLVSLVPDRPGGPQVAAHALAAWLAGFRGGSAGIGIYQGHAGFLAGVNAAKAAQPRLKQLAARSSESLSSRLAGRRWPPDAVGWDDYDLISGPAGAVLALTTDPAVPPDLVRPGALLLAKACGDLDGLRLRSRRRDQLRGWNLGHINTGVGHGVAGMVAALSSACDVLGTPDECATALDRVARWLAGQAYADARGLLTWPHAGLDGSTPPATPSRRQAWCYGTPGISWTLWEAGRVLGCADLRELAVEAFTSFCGAFDEERYLYDTEPGDLDSLAFCHGAAGTLAIADAFARYPELPAAACLRDRLERYLLDRLGDVPALAERWLLLLNGATGVLAALLTVRGGDRAWLAQYGLR